MRFRCCSTVRVCDVRARLDSACTSSLGRCHWRCVCQRERKRLALCTSTGASRVDRRVQQRIPHSGGGGGSGVDGSDSCTIHRAIQFVTTDTLAFFRHRALRVPLKCKLLAASTRRQIVVCRVWNYPKALVHLERCDARNNAPLAGVNIPDASAL
jgi:hypothetical protein